MSRLTPAQYELLDATANALSTISYRLVMTDHESRFPELEEQIMATKAWIERRFGLHHVAVTKNPSGD